LHLGKLEVFQSADELIVVSSRSISGSPLDPIAQEKREEEIGWRMTDNLVIESTPLAACS
jgi:hypothetical protein